MELRDFFTPGEIKEMKERIIKETASYAFLSDKTMPSDGDGPYQIKVLENRIHEAVRDEANKIIREYVKEVINTKVKDKIADAAAKFTEKLVGQLDEITEKTKWYWSTR